MCDEQTEKDIDELFRREGDLTRRKFGKLSAAVGLTFHQCTIALSRRCQFSHLTFVCAM